VRIYVQLFCMIAIMAGLFVACGTSPVEENVPYMIMSKNEKFCFDVPNAQKNSVQIILWNASDPNNPALHHKWYFRKVEDGYKIFSEVANLCLDVAGGSGENNARILQWKDSGDQSNNQIWYIESNNDGYAIISKISGKLISAEEGNAQRGAKLVQYEADSTWADAQTWVFKKLQ